MLEKSLISYFVNEDKNHFQIKENLKNLSLTDLQHKNSEGNFFSELRKIIPKENEEIYNKKSVVNLKLFQNKILR